MRRLSIFIVLSLLFTVSAGIASANPPCDNGTTVRGHCDRDGNVVGNYTSVYAYDATGDYYWDLGDGRVQTTPGITSVDDLDAATLTTCDYVINYRGDFGSDPFLNSGWIQNNIRCYGYDDNNHYKYLIVHESDPRYTGNPEWATWGTWEYHAYNISGQGNLVRPQTAVGSD